MNTAIVLGIGLVGIVALVIGFLVALRAKRQFGFYAPLGFWFAALINRACFLLSLPVITRSMPGPSHDKTREMASKLSQDELFFYLGTEGHADGIWFLGAILFLVCGWLDLKSSGTQSSRKTRLALVVGGSLVITLAAIYPAWVLSRFSDQTISRITRATRSISASVL